MTPFSSIPIGLLLLVCLCFLLPACGDNDGGQSLSDTTDGDTIDDADQEGDGDVSDGDNNDFAPDGDADEADKPDGDAEELEKEDDVEGDEDENLDGDCHSDCPVRDDCSSFLREYCPDRDTTDHSDICLNGILHTCMTSPCSTCCEGLEILYIPIETCSETTTGCQDAVDAIPTWFNLPTEQQVCYTLEDIYNHPPVEDFVIECPGEAGSESCGNTPGCGQDAQYPDPNYDPNREFEVLEPDGEIMWRDTLTGRIWAGDTTYINNRISRGQFWAFCADLDYGGFTDWRLPSIHELRSLVDLNQRTNFGKPVSQLPYFQDDRKKRKSVNTDEYWSSTWALPYVDGQNPYQFAYGIDFLDGSIGILMDDYTCWGSAGVFPGALCVRSDSDDLFTQEAIANRYTSSTPSGASEPIVEDSLTSLTWQGKISTERPLTWADALATCENLDYAGLTDWRLPNYNELLTLLDPTKHWPTTSFPGMGVYNYGFFTSTAVPGENAVRYVDFRNGYTSFAPKNASNSGLVLCVRGGGGQSK